MTIFRQPVRKTCLLILVTTLLLVGLNAFIRADDLSSGNDPGGAVTGNDSDVLDTKGNRLIYSEKWKTSEPSEPKAEMLAPAIGRNRIGLNISWTLLTGFMVMFMSVGFALLEYGVCRAKNSAHVVMTTMMIYPLAALGFWAVGFAWMFGGIGPPPDSLGAMTPLAGAADAIRGNQGYFLGVQFYDVGVFTLFLFQAVFLCAMATIPTGAMAERWKLSAFVGYGIFVSTVFYPLYGHWLWGGGWLSDIGNWAVDHPLKMHGHKLGHGAVDFAGSGVVHALGGWTALAGAIVLGPRIGRFDKGKSLDMPGHQVALGLVGTLILAFGWFGFNCGSTLQASGAGALRIGVIATNTMLASAAGAITAMLFCWKLSDWKVAGWKWPTQWKFRQLLQFKGKPDAPMSANGLLAGCVAITASCAYVDSLAAVKIGIIAGLLVCLAAGLLEKWHLDDPANAVAVHGVCGTWGLISVGVFADGTYGQTLNNAAGKIYLDATHPGVTGCLNGDWGQLGAQLFSALICFAFAVLFSGIFFLVQDIVSSKLQGIPWRFQGAGGIRVGVADEIEGTDTSELGIGTAWDSTLLDQRISDAVERRLQMLSKEERIEHYKNML